eukprot:gnl/MRDRNA2_/MRDRNA2_28231_c0_seq1.p1 gnl/MRDRNA2_/MRDRNA2_28231_c0~~gnl/MRDRNA2_/MRDRNA2_28231_c0_seq1.p1  ORF type:complete len:609 (-),score=146.52 gnl/MRDRNA2_/MRDRNA2_28231_c0_seq1:13-1770(-)
MLDMLMARWDQELAGHHRRAGQLAQDLSLQRADLAIAQDARNAELDSLGRAALLHVKEVALDRIRQVAQVCRITPDRKDIADRASPLRKPSSARSKEQTLSGPFGKLCIDIEAAMNGEVAALQRSCDAAIDLRTASQDGERLALRNELLEAQQITEAIRTAAWAESAERGAVAQRARALARGYEAEAESAVQELVSMQRPVIDLEVQHQLVCEGLEKRAAEYELHSQRLASVLNETSAWHNAADSAQRNAEEKLLEIQTAARAIVSDQELQMKRIEAQRESALGEVEDLLRKQKEGDREMEKLQQEAISASGDDIFEQTKRQEEFVMVLERGHLEAQECNELSKRVKLLEAENFNQRARICEMQAEEGTLEVRARQVGWEGLRWHSEYGELREEYAVSERQIATLCENLSGNVAWEQSELNRERIVWQKERLRQDHSMSGLRRQLEQTCHSLVAARAENEMITHEYMTAEQRQRSLSDQMAAESNQAQQTIQIIEKHFIQLKEEARELQDALHKERLEVRAAANDPYLLRNSVSKETTSAYSSSAWSRESTKQSPLTSARLAPLARTAAEVAAKYQLAGVNGHRS